MDATRTDARLRLSSSQEAVWHALLWSRACSRTGTGDTNSARRESAGAAKLQNMCEPAPPAAQGVRRGAPRAERAPKKILRVVEG